MFTGKVTEFQNFIMQCTLSLTLCLIIYLEDEDHILFIISHLRGMLLTWACDIIFNHKHPLHKNYTAFMPLLPIYMETTSMRWNVKTKSDISNKQVQQPLTLKLFKPSQLLLILKIQMSHVLW